MKPRHRRFAWIGAGVLLLAVAAGLVLNAFQSNLVFFFSPTDVAENRAPQGRAFRIGGMVVEKSLTRASDGLTVRFSVPPSNENVFSYTRCRTRSANVTAESSTVPGSSIRNSSPP